MDLSVVVPLYNEEDSVEPLYEALRSALNDLELDYEVVLVDDGSEDRTFDLARRIAASDDRLRIIRFRRNYGQTPAMAAGIDHANGDIVVTMDGDLQNDPRDIGKLVSHVQTEYDIAVGWRHDRQDKLITRKVPSKIANWLIGKITGVPIKDNGCSLKAFRASVIKRVPLYSDMHRFIPAMASLVGATVVEVKVRHHARRYGSSKYGLGRIYKVLVDLLSIKTIVSFANRPLLWFTILALPFALLSLGSLVAALWSLAAPGGSMSISLGGTGLLLGALSVFLILNGALAELIYKTGDVDLTGMSLLTMAVTGEGRIEQGNR